MRRTERKLVSLTDLWCWPIRALRTWMKTGAPEYDSSIRSNYAWMLEYLRWPHGIELVQHWESAELDDWRLSCKGSYWVCYRSRRYMHLRMWYIRQKGTHIFTMVYCVRMWQLSQRSIRQYRRHTFPFMCSSGPCLQNILHNTVAVNGGGREFGI